MKKIMLFLLIIINIFFVTSCAESKIDVNKLAVIIGYGVDITPEGKYMMTSQILTPQKANVGGIGGMGKSKGQSSGSGVVVVRVIGDNFLECINELSTKVGREPFFGQVRITVIGKSLAESGLAELLDANLRWYTARPEIPIIVTPGKAEDIMNEQTTLDPIPSNVMMDLANIQRKNGFSPVVSRMEFANLLMSDTAAPIAGVIEINKDGDELAFKMRGTAVFKKDKLIGLMNETETRGMQWVAGKVQSGRLALSPPDKKIISFDILRSSSKIKPLINGNKIVMEVNIKEQGNMMNLIGKKDPMENPQLMKEFDEIQNKIIKGEIEQAVYAAQKKLKADVFNFGEIIHREYPEKWNSIKKNWNEIFPNIDVKINVKCQTKRTGLIGKPAY